MNRLCTNMSFNWSTNSPGLASNVKNLTMKKSSNARNPTAILEFVAIAVKAEYVDIENFSNSNVGRSELVDVHLYLWTAFLPFSWIYHRFRLLERVLFVKLGTLSFNDLI